MHLNPWGGEPWGSFPAMRRWRPGATAAEFKPIAPATRIYRTDEPLDPHQGVALHTVTVCDLAKAEMDCESTAVLFLRSQSLRLTELGALDSQSAANANDGCRASCVDWYGNARPVFLNNRVFALMGYEIVEGRVTGGQIAEVQRVSFSPVNVSLAR